VRRITRHTQQVRTILAAFEPDRTARAGTMNDADLLAAQRQACTVDERHAVRQPAQPLGKPGAVPLREILCIGKAAAHRHRQDRLSAGRVDAQRIAARAAMPAHGDVIDLAAGLDRDDLRRGIARNRTARRLDRADSAQKRQPAKPMTFATHRGSIARDRIW
jgi:hypothetical protein